MYKWQDFAWILYNPDGDEIARLKLDEVGVTDEELAQEIQNIFEESDNEWGQDG